MEVNITKTKIMVKQKKPKCQEKRHIFTLGNKTIEHTMCYTYLGLQMTASGSFRLAVNALKEKACRAFFAIKQHVHKIGRFPLTLEIPKRSLTFYTHLKSSPEETLQSKALAVHEVNPEKSPLCQLVMRLTNQLPPGTPPSQSITPSLTPNRIQLITTENQNSYLELWEKETKTQN